MSTEPTRGPAVGPRRWHAVAASERGSAHSPDGENQDAVLVRELDGPSTGLGLVAAVADGHGGRAHMRSGAGSQMAVELATTVLVSAARYLTGPPRSRWMADQMRRVIELWRSQVVAHHDATPFTDVERGLGASDVNPWIAYGSTLLVALVLEDDVLLAQLGDGDVLVSVEGVARRPMPADDRLFANQTTSLCLPESHADVRYAELCGAIVCDLVILATDGYGNSFAQEDWWSLVVEDFSRLAQVWGSEELGRQLPGWLADSARVGGDDTSVVVLSSSSGPVTAAGPSGRTPP